jgi:osmotically-inducible protein OsmY
MGDKWNDDRDRQMRERDWRRSEHGRGENYGADRSGEDRSFRSDDEGGYGEPGGYRGQGAERVFGERETGASYARPGGGAYGGGGSYGGGESYGRGAGGGRPGGYRGGPTSGASAYRGPAPRVSSQDYTQGGRFYGDDERQAVYREEYGQGGVEYGDVPRGYDARRQGGSRGGSYGSQQPRPAYGGTAAGGTGGYDYERGYGDGGRRDDRDERRPGDFLQKAGERVANWFRGDDHLRDSGYQPESRRGDRPEDRGHRGMGPKGYKRSDERISDEVHERLTDDSWLDASGISVSVSGGEVTLSGTVETREAKHRAERLVEDISGVNHVQNNLRVTPGGFLTSPGRGYGDSVLDAQMRNDDPAATGSGGAGGGQSTAGKKS